MSYLTPEQEKLLEEHRHLVFFTLRTYMNGYAKADKDDICSAGLIGLMTACKTYDESRGVAFVTYAVKCIWMRMSMEKRKLNRQRRYEVSLENPLPNQNDNSVERDTLTISARVSYNQDMCNALIAKDTLARLSCLKGRSREIANLTLQGYTGAEIGRQLGISREAVNRYLTKIREFLTTDIETLKETMRKNSIYYKIPEC